MAGNSDSMILWRLILKQRKPQWWVWSGYFDQDWDWERSSSEAKLNAAYANGKQNLQFRPFKMMNIRFIDRYVMVKYAGAFQQLVDGQGSLSPNTLGFPLLSTKKSLILLSVLENKPNGEESLRIHGCVTTQKETISSKTSAWSHSKIVEKVLSLNSVSHYQGILKAWTINMQNQCDLSAKSIPINCLRLSWFLQEYRTHHYMEKMLSYREFLYQSSLQNICSKCKIFLRRSSGKKWQNWNQCGTVRNSLWSDSTFNQ